MNRPYLGVQATGYRPDDFMQLPVLAQVRSFFEINTCLCCCGGKSIDLCGKGIQVVEISFNLLR